MQCNTMQYLVTRHNMLCSIVSMRIKLYSYFPVSSWLIFFQSCSLGSDVVLEAVPCLEAASRQFFCCLGLALVLHFLPCLASVLHFLPWSWLGLKHKLVATSVFASYAERDQPKSTTVTVETLIQSYMRFISDPRCTWETVPKFEHYESVLPLLDKDVVLGTCTCTRVQLEYRFQVLVLVLVLEG